ncbi:aromatic-ring-hydroxylating dioxygenase subunit beta [Bordetella sp. BOR01]|uniref:aromatic-ring-hydroxylating dioxygenase subunit beta n=1 Tax=Bordetella sp. BOR01 TaxID=2854779 RepID=UPI001C4885D1|nr:aromatic-ring-hydroxylating dioxygenase subunit beta [Bordetella sp. BOR01]MBV7486702.1 aromatic-ring-hydroxylating dioxygenase subunit beta [Bordetella sp. BOR01]
MALGSISTLRSALRDFYDDYAHCLDTFDLQRWPDFFTEDCRYRVLSAENYDAGLPLSLIYCDGRNMLKDRVTALKETTVYEPRHLRHFVAGVRVLGQEDGLIRATANFMILESLSDQEPVVNMVGRYVDALVETGQGFLLKERYCVHDNYRVRNSLIIPI